MKLAIDSRSKGKPTFYGRWKNALHLFVFPGIGLLLGLLGWIAFITWGPATWAEWWNVPLAGILGFFVAFWLSMNYCGIAEFAADLSGVAAGLLLTLYTQHPGYLLLALVPIAILSGAYCGWDIVKLTRKNKFHGYVRGWWILRADRMLMSGIAIGSMAVLPQHFIPSLLLLAGPGYIAYVLFSNHIQMRVMNRMFTPEEKAKYNAGFT